jgi:glutamate racemase
MVKKEKKIAILDSGVGGITVFEKLKKLLPNENYTYFGDLKNFPYGDKTYDELLKFTTQNFNFFKELGIKAVVMACNTTSATVYDVLKNNYDFKIYPIIQSCANVIAKLPVKRIGVFATEATIKNGAYGRELKKYNPDLEVFELACPSWVKIVEEKTQNEPESIEAVKFYLEKMLKNNPDKIILGCTHYPYLLEVLEKFAPREIFIDPSEYFAEFIKSDLGASGLLNDSSKGSEKFLVSANPEKFKEAASLFYSLKDLPQLTTF